jgi:hypothetical protein
MAHDESAASDLLARLAKLNGAITVVAEPPSPPPPQSMILPGEQSHQQPPRGVVIEAPASLVETGEIALLPHNPITMTPCCRPTRPHA